MIFLDIQKAKAAKAAELEKNNEEEIDISDEASTFKPVMITRDEAPKNNSGSDSTENTENNKTDNEVKTDDQKSETSKPETPIPEPPAQEKKPESEKSDRPTPEEPHKENPEPAKDSTEEHTAQDSAEEDSPETSQSSEKPFRRPGYREAIMTGYISVDSLINEANKLAETGEWDLGNVIHTCDNAA